MANKEPNPWIAALVVLVPLYAVVIWLGWTALMKKPPSVMGEHYEQEEIVAQDAREK